MNDGTGANFDRESDTRGDPAAENGAKSQGKPGRRLEESPDSSGFSLVPREGFFEGQVAVHGRTYIDGTIRGSVRGSGEVVLGPEARIDGVIECDVISSRGVIVGPVVARISAHFGRGAHFEGDLDAPVVKIDSDVVWIGAARVGG